MMRRAKALVLFFTLICLPAISPLHAAVWDGGGADANWMTAANWNPNTAPSPGDPLVFPGGAFRLSNNNNFAVDTLFDSITFSVANYQLNGNAVQLDNGIASNQSGGINEIGLSIQLTQDQSFTVQNDGAALRINGDVDLDGSTLTLGGAGDILFQGDILGTGGVVKAGPGFLRLSGNNSYDEITTVSDGILEVSNTAGSATGSGGVIVEGGAELQGDGNMDGEVLVEAGGEISPGTVDPAILGVGGLILEADSVLVIQIDGPVPGTEYSSLEVTGTVVLNQPIFRIALGPAVTAGDDFTIIDNDSGDAVAGTLKNLQEGETFHLVGIDDVGFEITYQGGDGNDVVLTSIPTVSIDDTAVAEPASGTVNAVFTVTLTEASDETITVQFSTADGTATAPADYTAENGTVTFNPGETSKIIAVTVNGDSVSEGDENFFVNLSGPTHATIVKNQGIATITSSGGGGGGAGNGGCSLNRQARSPLSLGWLLFAAPLFLARGFLKIPWSAVNSPLK